MHKKQRKQTFASLLRFFLKLEWADLHQNFLPINFAFVVILLFGFAFGDLPRGFHEKMFVAEIFLTLFLTLQIQFSKVFEQEIEDGALTLMRTYPISAEQWFLAKFVAVVMGCWIIVFLTAMIGAFLNQQVLGYFFPPWNLLAVAFLATLGLAALGVLLSAMTQRIRGRQVIFSVLYFPLCIPVLVAACSAANDLLTGERNFNDLISDWIGMLLIFDIIYITLATLLFGEIQKPD